VCLSSYSSKGVARAGASTDACCVYPLVSVDGVHVVYDTVYVYYILYTVYRIPFTDTIRYTHVYMYTFI
jgi:hypothetical protein